MAGMNWEKCERGTVCPFSVRGDTGNDAPIVAAAHHEGGFIPGMYLPESHVCLIPWGCKAHHKEDYYVLSSSGSNVAWVEASDGNVPIGALEAGVSETGEALYVGRLKKDGKMYTGKIHPSHKVCYIPFPDGNREENSRKYEVLCLKTVPMPSSNNVEVEGATCPVCTEPYSSGIHDPLMLPDCGHTFCRSCLVRINQREHSLMCPTCRIPHTRPPLEQLKVNFTVLNLAQQGKT